MSIERSVLMPELTIDEYFYYMGDKSLTTKEEIIQKFKECPKADYLYCVGKRFNNGDGTYYVEGIRIKRPV